VRFTQEESQVWAFLCKAVEEGGAVKHVLKHPAWQTLRGKLSRIVIDQPMMGAVPSEKERLIAQGYDEREAEAILAATRREG
jgi:hypothetical protein